MAEERVKSQSLERYKERINGEVWVEGVRQGGFMGADPGGIRLLCRKGIFKLLKRWFR